MATITRNRTIRTSSRLESSKSYKIDTKNIGRPDTLIVNIDHESKSFNKTYTFKGEQVTNRDSISFRVIDYGTHIDISWSGANPVGNSYSSTPKKINTVPKEKNLEGLKIEGLAPIYNANSKVLILGTMPGAESLKNQEYYSYSRNLFWDLVSESLSKKKPTSYSEKKKLLLDNKIAIWDVCKTCVREGSLDANIEDEVPNDLASFLNENKNIKVLAFNGKEAAKLFGKSFGSISGIKLISLPSSSTANTGQSWDFKVVEWSMIKEFL